jgi:hypothetical protein
MIRTNTILLLLVLYSPGSFGQPQSGDAKPIETTLCEVVAHSVRFVGKVVRFRASVESDGLENTVLVDSKCNLGMIPRIPDQFTGRPGVQAFERAFDVVGPGTLDKRMVATFTGKFVRKGQKRILEVQEVQNLEVAPLPKAQR